MQIPQYSTFKIATYETFLKINKIFSFFFSKKLKNYASYKKKHEKNLFFFHLLHLCTKFQSPVSNNEKIKHYRSPYKVHSVTRYSKAIDNNKFHIQNDEGSQDFSAYSLYELQRGK